MNLMVLEPAIIAISESDWLIEGKRDSYLRKLMEVVSIVTEMEDVAVAWSEHLDEIIWGGGLLPWRKDAVFNNRLVPILYQAYNEKFQTVEVNSSHGVSIDPHLKSHDSILYDAFLEVLGYCFDVIKKFILFLGEGNSPDVERVFMRNGCVVDKPIMVWGRKDVYATIDITNNFWPANSRDHSRFIKGIEICLLVKYNCTTPVYKYCMSENFIKKIAEIKDDRERILCALAKRLTLSHAGARGDGALQDEAIGDEFRFRVSKAKRIHYEIDNGLMRFLMYYDESEHDDGLRGCR